MQKTPVGKRSDAVVCQTSLNDKQNRKSAEGYSRSKVEKRHGITGLNNWSISKSPKGRGTRVRKGKPSLLTYHARCKCSMETNRNSVKVNFGIKVMTLMECLIGWEVTVTNQGSECHLTFVRGILNIVESDPLIEHETFWMTIRGIPV